MRNTGFLTRFVNLDLSVEKVPDREAILVAAAARDVGLVASTRMKCLGGSSK